MEGDEQDILNAYQQAAGFAREELAQRTKAASDELKYKYAALKSQAKTAAQELAVDRWYKGEQIKLATRAAELAEKQFGLSYADKMTEYLSGPDTMFQARQLERSAGALMANRNAPGYRADGDMEQARQASGFEAMAGPRPSGVSAQSAGSLSPLYAPPPGSRSTMVREGAGAGSGSVSAVEPKGSGTDPRIKAIQAVAQALPPSSEPGLAARDNSAQRAFEAIYSAPGNDMDRADTAGSQLLARGGSQLGLGQFESLLPGTRKALMSLARTKGINTEDWLADWQRSRPGQASGHLA